jgi:hypothetical protein
MHIHGSPVQECFLSALRPSLHLYPFLTTRMHIHGRPVQEGFLYVLRPSPALISLFYTRVCAYMAGLCKNASFLPFGGQRAPEQLDGDTTIRPTYRNLKLPYFGDEEKKDAEQDVVMGSVDEDTVGENDPKIKMQGILKLDGCVYVCILMGV